MNNYWLIGGGAILGILIVASIVVAVLQKEAEFAPGLPEAAVQAYLRALDEDDFQTAYDLLSSELQSRCSIEDMFGGNRSGWWRLHGRRITLEDTRAFDETTFVTVKIARSSGGGLFGPSEYSFEESFALRQFDGHWKFSQNPWPGFDCARPAPVGLEWELTRRTLLDRASVRVACIGATSHSSILSPTGHSGPHHQESDHVAVRTRNR